MLKKVMGGLVAMLFSMSTLLVIAPSSALAAADDTQAAVQTENQNQNQDQAQVKSSAKKCNSHHKKCKKRNKKRS